MLEALAPRYLRRVVGVTSGSDDALHTHVNEDDPIPTLDVLGAPVSSFVQLADQLLASAYHFDPLGSWGRVTRIGNRRRWGELRHDALLAPEFHIAAEVLL